MLEMYPPNGSGMPDGAHPFARWSTLHWIGYRCTNTIQSPLGDHSFMRARAGLVTVTNLSSTGVQNAKRLSKVVTTIRNSTLGRHCRLVTGWIWYWSGWINRTKVSMSRAGAWLHKVNITGLRSCKQRFFASRPSRGLHSCEGGEVWYVG